MQQVVVVPLDQSINSVKIGSVTIVSAKNAPGDTQADLPLAVAQR